MIGSVLVANRGEIARRVFRTARAMGMTTVAVFSDADAGLPFVREADLAVRLPGVAPAETYLRGDLVVEAALRTGAQAVHPGYGFLSEDAGFARAVLDAGLGWVGPSPEVIAAMGSKLHAKALMADAGVPVLPGEDVSGISGGDLRAAAERVGYPVLVKASYGGGGRGMRAVHGPEQLEEAVEGAAREAAAAFGDGTVFLERLVERPRHVEVQLLGDTQGTVVALPERECSVQRRHQKVVEESPSPAVDDALRARLQDAAVAAGRALGYVGAGTVEFVLAPGGEFAFLEVNTRLQVEHPVTELVTGLDLVRVQLEVAAGQPLPASVVGAVASGWAVEARLYAEDPARDWLPQTGALHAFDVPGPVRVDAGVEAGSEVGSAYDPMLAKVVAHAGSRTEACLVLADALARAEVAGVGTNRDLLVRVLRSPAFLAGEVDTGFLERHGGTDPARLAAPLLGPAERRLSAVLAALALGAARRSGARALATLPSGWRNNPTQPQRVRLDGPDGEVEVAYAHRRGGLEAAVDGEPVALAVLTTSVGDRVALDVEADLGRGPVRLAARVLLAGGAAHVHSPLGSGSWRVLPRFPDPLAALAPGSLVAPMPGTVVRVLVAPGDAVAAGQPVAVLEAMKMEHAVAAPGPGTVAALPVAVGDRVDAGTVLAVVDPA